MRPAMPVAVLVAVLTLPLPAGADQAGQEAACIGAASQQLGIASFAAKVIDVSPSLGGAIVTLSLPSQLATCIVTDANEVMEITSGDGRTTALEDSWRQDCISTAATMQGVPMTSVAMGANIGGQAEVLILGGQPMVCNIGLDGSMQNVSYR
jgi:hypothetical protein